MLLPLNNMYSEVFLLLQDTRNFMNTVSAVLKIPEIHSIHFFSRPMSQFTIGSHA